MITSIHFPEASVLSSFSENSLKTKTHFVLLLSAALKTVPSAPDSSPLLFSGPGSRHHNLAEVKKQRYCFSSGLVKQGIN
ncbi:hypothetical protein ACFSC6_06740 [Rufibacter sediminis]|uniref:hypothetical protein n=1 Tax=Rufibacter sediminis TaxID=2762756 RepID=UPI002109ADE3|nr:hypothetical protein [Rufibacter sediminis]